MYCRYESAFYPVCEKVCSRGVRIVMPWFTIHHPPPTTHHRHCSRSRVRRQARVVQSFISEKSIWFDRNVRCRFGWDLDGDLTCVQRGLIGVWVGNDWEGGGGFGSASQIGRVCNFCTMHTCSQYYSLRHPQLIRTLAELSSRSLRLMLCCHMQV